MKKQPITARLLYPPKRTARRRRLRRVSTPIFQLWRTLKGCGNDVDSLLELIMQLKYLPRIIGLKLIKLYQQTLSPDHGPLARLYPHGYCKFHPTCSMYTFQAVEKYGLMRGALLGCWRVLRCNPWSKGGNDPVK